ncbi:MAG: hypothetical protein ACREP9_15410 [Candidatus Dormibacteraceae bacterium]
MGKTAWAGLAAMMLLSACGGSGPAAPVHSAAKACKDFSTWYLAHESNILSGVGSAQLNRAIREAPSGRLYHAMSTFQSDIQTAAAASSTLQTPEKDFALTAALSVANQCQSVNPNS